MIGNGFATAGFEVMSEQSSWIQLGPLRNWMTIVAWGIGHEMKTPVARVAAVPGQGEKDQGTPTARGLPASPIAFKAFCGRKFMAKEFLGPVFQVESFPEQSRRIQEGYFISCIFFRA